MSTFWRVRLATAAYGFAVTFLFTGSLFTSLGLMVVLILGNTLIMRALIRS